MSLVLQKRGKSQTPQAAEPGSEATLLHLDPRWKPGEQILQQDLWNGQLISSRPVTVAADNREYLGLYTHPHTPFHTAGLGGRRYELPLTARVDQMISPNLPKFQLKTSGEKHVLTLTPPCSGLSFWLFWDPDWRLTCWYVNLQMPVERFRRGIVVRDMTLDLRVETDGSWS